LESIPASIVLVAVVDAAEFVEDPVRCGRRRTTARGVLCRQEETRLAGSALASGAATQLVDAPDS